MTEKLIYLIIAHKCPAQVVRLIDRLDSGTASFFIHVNRREKAVYAALGDTLRGRANCFLVEPVPVRWADLGLVRACIAGFRAIQASQLDYGHVIILSGQDYPLKSNCAIEGALSAYSGKQVLEYFPLPHPEWQPDQGMQRIERYHFWMGDRRFAYPLVERGRWKNARALANKLLGVLIPRNRALPSGYKPYAGSCWLCLTKGCVAYILDLVQTGTGKALLRYYAHTWGSAEMFFQTVIAHSPWRESTINATLHQISWAKGKANPRVFTKDDINILETSDKLFARKFDVQVDADILDLVDQRLLGERNCLANGAVAELERERGARA